MVDSTEWKVTSLLCLVVLVLGLFALSRSLNPPDTKVIGVSLALVVLSLVVAVAAYRSRQGSEEIPVEPERDGDVQ